MIRFIYNLLFPLGLLVFMPGYLLRMRRRGNYRRNFGQRFGFYDAELLRRLARARSSTWIHAVSVGEVAIALKLAAKLRELDLHFQCVLTTTTTTGYAIAEKEAGEWIRVIYNPLDWLPIVRCAYSVIRPVRIILVEAEVWPNLAAEARRRRIPIALVNARLSIRSERRFRRFHAFVAPTFACLDRVFVQDAADIGRWHSLGVPKDRITLAGSIKFDPMSSVADFAVPCEVLNSFGFQRDTPVLLGGSTHSGEEAILAETYVRLRAEFPGLRLIVAPRHAERATDVRLTVEAFGLRVAQRSETPAISTEVDCLLLDTTGELRSWYAAATVVFIGKSLTANGGQNPVEPILAGKPVIFGPHMENFAALAQSLLREGGAVQISAPDELTRAAADLLRDEPKRAELVKNAHHVLASHRGATERTASQLLTLKSAANGSD